MSWASVAVFCASGGGGRVAVGELLGEAVPLGQARRLCQCGRDKCAADVSRGDRLCAHPFRGFATASVDGGTGVLTGSATIVHELDRNVVG